MNIFHITLYRLGQVKPISTSYAQCNERRFDEFVLLCYFCDASITLGTTAANTIPTQYEIRIQWYVLISFISVRERIVLEHGTLSVMSAIWVE